MCFLFGCPYRGLTRTTRICNFNSPWVNSSFALTIMLSDHAEMACKANKATVGTPPGKKSHQMNLPTERPNQLGMLLSVAFL